MAAAPTIGIDIDLPTATAVTSYDGNINIQRGRSSPLFDDFNVGRMTTVLFNDTRRFDPLYAAGPYFGELVPGRQVTVSATPTGLSAVTIFDGVVEDWSFDYPTSKRAYATVSAADALATLARAEFDEWTTTFGEYPGARLTTILARPEVDYTGSTAFDTGVTPLQQDVVSYGSNVLNYCQLVTRTDLGYFFASRTGVLTFLDRLAFSAASAAAAFGDSGATIPFTGIKTTYGTELLFNRVQVDRVRGPYEEEDPTPQVVTDATSISDYRRTLTLRQSGLLMQNDAAALDLATYELSVFKDPLTRVETLTVELPLLTAAQQSTVLGLDIGSVVTVAWTPSGVTPALTRTCVVDGIRHAIAPATHTIEFTLNDSGVVQAGDYFEPNSGANGQFVGGVQTFPIPF
jgi:hypothetical protein